MVTQLDRRLVYARDNYRCAHCGRNDTLTIQHRAGRGMGGSKKADRLANLVTLCWQANVTLESDAEFARLGRDKGWKISRWDDPEEVPVFYAPEGAFFMLNHRGTRIRKDNHGFANT